MDTAQWQGTQLSKQTRGFQALPVLISGLWGLVARSGKGGSYFIKRRFLLYHENFSAVFYSCSMTFVYAFYICFTYIYTEACWQGWRIGPCFVFFLITWFCPEREGYVNSPFRQAFPLFWESCLTGFLLTNRKDYTQSLYPEKIVIFHIPECRCLWFWKRGLLLGDTNSGAQLSLAQVCKTLWVEGYLGGMFSGSVRI